MQIHDTQVALHEPSNTAIHINKARTGLDCNCVCLDCRRRLIAVKNFKNPNAKPYFQHHNPDNKNPCNFSKVSRETALHLALKRQIYEEKCIAAPKVKISRLCPHENYRYRDFSVYSGIPLHFDNVLIEKKTGSIIPDCIGVIGEYRVAIEIKVTHGVDEGKIEKYREQGLDCLEVYAPNQLENFNPSKIINDDMYIEWIHFGRVYKESTMQACDRWFEKEKKRVEAEIDSRSKKIANDDITLRPKRIKRLFGRLMKRWDDEYLRFTPFDHSFYDDYDNNLDDICSRVPDLVYLPFPYSMKYELDRLRKRLDVLRAQQIKPEAEYIEARKKLISAFKYQHARCSAGSIEQITPLLDQLSNNNINDIRIGLKKYLDDMRLMFIEKAINRSKTNWVKKHLDSGVYFDNPDYEFMVSPEYERALNSIKSKLEGLGLSEGMTQSFYELIESYLEKKYQVDNPDVSSNLKYEALLKQQYSLQKRLNQKVVLYIRTITGPHQFNRSELSECVEGLLSPFRIAKQCAKELIFIKMAADFNNQVLPYNRSIRNSIEKEIYGKVSAMSNEALKRELLLVEEEDNFN